MKLIKRNIITEIQFKNGKSLYIGEYEYAYDGIITHLNEIDDYIIQVLLADGSEGWAVYIDVNGNEVEYNED